MTRPVDLKFNYGSSNDNEECSKDETFACNICGKNFYRKASLTVHVNSHTVVKGSSDDTQQETRRENTCNICCKRFTAKKNLLKHLRDVHKNYKEAERMVVKKIKCPERDCEFICRMMKELRDHIEKCHNVKILKDTLQFTSEAEFQKWKKEEESSTVSWFVTNRKKTTLTDGTKKQTLCCHRTGHYNPKGFGKYRMRSVGSCKIGVTCPAAMEVTEFPDGQLTVIYYKTHLGHVQDVVYLKLSREERADLADKIEQGFTFDAILEDVKESRDSKDANKKRIHLLSKKDLYSIMRTANNNNGKKTKKESEEKNRSEKPVDTKENSVTQEALLLRHPQVGKTDEGVHQNFTLYPAHSVVFPQEQAVDGASVLQKLGKDANLPQTSGEGVTPQIVILSPDVDYASVAEIILLSPQNKVAHQADRQPELSLEEKNRINRSNLRQQLKDKLDKISECLPQSEYLTPKQFQLINAKLDGVLNIFKEANAKAKGRRQCLKKRAAKKSRTQGDASQGVGGGHQVYEAPLVYAIYN